MYREIFHREIGTHRPRVNKNSTGHAKSSQTAIVAPFGTGSGG